jgi:hypothetical protein
VVLTLSLVPCATCNPPDKGGFLITAPHHNALTPWVQVLQCWPCCCPAFQYHMMLILLNPLFETASLPPALMNPSLLLTPHRPGPPPGAV